MRQVYECPHCGKRIFVEFIAAHIEKCKDKKIISQYDMKDCLGDKATVYELADGSAYYTLEHTPERRDYCLTERDAYHRIYSLGYKYPV